MTNHLTANWLRNSILESQSLLARTSTKLRIGTSRVGGSKPVQSIILTAKLHTFCIHKSPNDGLNNDRVLQPSSSLAPESRQFLATTPIFYVNAKPHLGHLHTLVLADVATRFAQLEFGPNDDKRKANWFTGTDEHGIKVMRAAQKQNIEPIALCDNISSNFVGLANKINALDNYQFLRTTDSTHYKSVQHFWNLLKNKGYIYEALHEGWYSVDDETFYAESSTEVTIEGKRISKETKSILEWSSENTYHFALSQLQSRLILFYKKYSQFVTPNIYHLAVLDELERTTLKDLSISRPSARLPWGIPVPNDPSQTIYVWFDALVNYLTHCGFPDSKDFEAKWPVNLHIIGKDIVRFHAIYWPAFLMAANLPLPHQILVHGHWTMSGQKMSKSRGNVVDPYELIDMYSADVMRYFLIRHGRNHRDTDFGQDEIVKTFETDLKNQLGNLLQRTLSLQVKISQSAVEFAHSKGEILSDKDSMQLHHCLNDLQNTVKLAIADREYYKVLEVLDNCIRNANSYISFKQPWYLIPKLLKNPNDEDSCARFFLPLYLCMETVRMCSILLLPICPSKAGQILDLLGVEQNKRSYQNVKLHSDNQYGRKILKKPAHLF